MFLKTDTGDAGGQFFPSVFIASQRVYMHYVGVSNINESINQNIFSFKRIAKERSKDLPLSFPRDLTGSELKRLDYTGLSDLSVTLFYSDLLKIIQI